MQWLWLNKAISKETSTRCEVWFQCTRGHQPTLTKLLAPLSALFLLVYDVLNPGQWRTDRPIQNFAVIWLGLPIRVCQCASVRIRPINTYTHFSRYLLYALPVLTVKKSSDTVIALPWLSSATNIIPVSWAAGLMVVNKILRRRPWSKKKTQSLRDSNHDVTTTPSLRTTADSQ